jgi:hypothetical protein
MFDEEQALESQESIETLFQLQKKEEIINFSVLIGSKIFSKATYHQINFGKKIN